MTVCHSVRRPVTILVRTTIHVTNAQKNGTPARHSQSIIAHAPPSGLSWPRVSTGSTGTRVPLTPRGPLTIAPPQVYWLPYALRGLTLLSYSWLPQPGPLRPLPTTHTAAPTGYQTPCLTTGLWLTLATDTRMLPRDSPLLCDLWQPGHRCGSCAEPCQRRDGCVGQSQIIMSFMP